MDHFFVYITTGNKDEALNIGRMLVQEQLVACVNILDPMTSVYRWEGKIVEESESVLIAKTLKDNIPSLVDRVKQLHSYSCPCIVILPITDGNKDYLQWIEQECQKGASPPPSSE
ncbi:MAG: divalent-cation tolerance protein CutA [Chitinispirillaceae bacterium]